MFCTLVLEFGASVLYLSLRDMELVENEECGKVDLGNSEVL